MYKYIIVENSESPHEEGILAICKLLKMANAYIILMLGGTNFFRAKELGLNNIANEIHFMKKSSSLFMLLKARNQNTAVIYNTISVRNSIFTFLTSFGLGKNIYYIRNANSWLKYSWHYTSIVDVIARNISTFLKKNMLSRENIVLVENSRIKNFLFKNNIKYVDVVPFKFRSDSYRKSTSTDLIKFIVPGLVDFSRKQIDLVVKSFLAIDLDLRKNVQLILLGKPKGQQEIDKCREWERMLGKSFTWYSSFVPVSEFSNKMSQCDVVITAFKTQHQCEHFSEVYGISRGSGVDAHAIAAAVPLIVNIDFEVDNEYLSSTIKFESEKDLTLIISNLIINAERLSEIKSLAITNSEKYTIESFFRKIKYLWCEK
jgi:hypothetical protein